MGGAMTSIWLLLERRQEQALQSLINRMAGRHGTVPFRPHLTVCSVPGDLAVLDAAAAYIKECSLLPLTLAKTAVTGAVITPFRAVFIEIENSAGLREFRERLRDIVGAPALIPPHISLLYTIDKSGQRTRWSSDESKLSAIAAESAARLDDTVFALDHPVVVTPDADWTNIRSWKIVREL